MLVYKEKKREISINIEKWLAKTQHRTASKSD